MPYPHRVLSVHAEDSFPFPTMTPIGENPLSPLLGRRVRLGGAGQGLADDWGWHAREAYAVGASASQRSPPTGRGGVPRTESLCEAVRGIAQARRAARASVGVGTVLRRYMAGHEHLAAALHV